VSGERESSWGHRNEPSTAAWNATNRNPEQEFTSYLANNATNHIDPES
jgi:hypothetical protein